MKKKGLLFLLAAAGALLAGCADYRDLDELSVVAGIAVDVSPEDPGKLSVSFELVDMYSSENSDKLTSSTLVTEGRSIAEAVYKSKEKLHDNMYFGNCEILVISSQAAETFGLNVILDPLLRDSEIRDNLQVLISGEETAKAIIESDEDTAGIISFDLNININSENHTVNATRPLELFQVYNILALHSSNLMLPEISLSPTERRGYVFSRMAWFTGDKLTGFMPQEQMPYYLLAATDLKGGGLYIDVDEHRYVSLAIRKSRPKTSYDYDGEQFRFLLDIELKADVSEFSQGWEDLGSGAIRWLEEYVAQFLAQQVKAVAEEYAAEQADIFALGDHVRNRDYSLWQQVEDAWWFYWLPSAEWNVTFTVKIDNTGMIDRY